MSLTYRLSQFLNALTARPTAEDHEQARRWLSQDLYRLFQGMGAEDQAHGLRVLSTLLERGHDHPDLLAAALLHDVGKSVAPVRPWQRALVVLAERFLGRWLPAISAPPAHSWRRPFVVGRWHPAWGAELARDAGGSETLQSLIANHHAQASSASELEVDRLLAALQSADRAN